MSKKLKPCPFCGGEAKNNGYVYTCPICGIVCCESWNTRPIEDALNARIAELDRQLAEAKEENKKLIMLTRKLMG